MGDTPANDSTQDGNNTSDTTSGADEKFEPITTQEELNARIGERLERERSKFADYEELKAKAARLDEIDDANKDEITRATEKAAAAEMAAAEAKAEAVRWKVAAKHGISDEDADLFLTGTDEETLTKQAQRLTERVADRKKTGNHVPREGGTTPKPKEDEMREFTRKLFSSATSGD